MVKNILLFLLLALLGITLQYQFGVPGTTVVDRLRAKPVVADLDTLSDRSDPDQIRQTYHLLHHTCTSESSMLGDSVCWAPITKFNEIEARILAFFFRDGKLSAVRVSFAAEQHPALFAQLQKRFGPHREFGAHADIFGNNIVGWMRPSGIVVTNDRVEGEQESLLLWVSSPQILRQVLVGHN